MRSHLFPSLPLLMFTALNYTTTTTPWIVVLWHRPCANSLSPARLSFVYPLSLLFHCLSRLSAKSTAQMVPPYNFLFIIALHEPSLTLSLLSDQNGFPFRFISLYYLFSIPLNLPKFYQNRFPMLCPVLSVFSLTDTWPMVGKQACEMNNCLSQLCYNSILAAEMPQFKKGKNLHSYMLFTVTSILYGLHK